MYLIEVQLITLIFIKSTFNISFVCRKSKANKLGYSAIEISIVINGERTYITLGRKERAEEFSKLVTSKRQNELKVYLSDVYQKTQSKVSEMMSQNIPLTAFNPQIARQTIHIYGYRRSIYSRR